MDSIQLDETDRVLTAALQLSPRASWQRIAHATDLSLSTVARRCSSLLDRGALRVVGLLDVQRCGRGVPVLVRIRCVPGSTEAVAAALSALSETRLVMIVAGAVDVVVELVCPNMAAMRTLLTTTVPSIPGIAATDADLVLRLFNVAPRWGRLILSAAAADDLEGEAPESLAEVHLLREPFSIDEVDDAVIAELSSDGRLGYKDLASKVGTSQSTVARRVEALQHSGVLHFRALVDPNLVGLRASFLLWLAVDPAHVGTVGQRLAAHPACGLWATAGRFNLVCLVVLPHHDALYAFTTNILGQLPGIRDLDITTQLAALKRGWKLTGGDSLSRRGKHAV